MPLQLRMLNLESLKQRCASFLLLTSTFILWIFQIKPVLYVAFSGNAGEHLSKFCE